MLKVSHYLQDRAHRILCGTTDALAEGVEGLYIRLNTKETEVNKNLTSFWNLTSIKVHLGLQHTTLQFNLVKSVQTLYEHTVRQASQEG